MQFNPDKCEVLRVAKKKNPLIQMQIQRKHGTELQTVDQAKYIGATISKDFSWNKHIESVAKKATTSLNFFKRNLHGCPSRVKKKCYTSLVRPLTEYASSAWDPHTQRNINNSKWSSEYSTKEGSRERQGCLTRLSTSWLLSQKLLTLSQPDHADDTRSDSPSPSLL